MLSGRAGRFPVTLVVAMVGLVGCTTSTIGVDGGTGLDDDSTRILLSDEFADDRHGWGGPYQRFENGVYRWDLPPGLTDTRAADTLIGIERELAAARTTTTFTATGASAVGIQCAYEQSGGTSRWYSLQLGTQGATITRQPYGQGAEVTTLASSAEVTLTDQQTTIQTDCVAEDERYLLALLVGGVMVLTAEDPEPFGAGAPGLTVLAAPTSDGGEPSIVRFDDFVVRVPLDGPVAGS